jgi:hypothetical protein
VQTILPSYQVQLKPGAWEGSGHIWKGDTVNLRFKSGRLRVDAELRVMNIHADIGDKGEEVIVLTLGNLTPEQAKKYNDVFRRLETLERS